MGASVSKEVDDAKLQLAAMESRLVDISRDVLSIKFAVDALTNRREPAAPSSEKTDIKSEERAGLPHGNGRENYTSGRISTDRPLPRNLKRKKSVSAVEASSQEQNEDPDEAPAGLFTVARILSAMKLPDGKIYFDVQWEPSPKQKKQKKGGDITTEPIENLFPGARALVERYVSRTFGGNKTISQPDLLEAVREQIALEDAEPESPLTQNSSPSERMNQKKRY
eukprot:jgi/Mesvir1/2790/Mv13724-RA.1